MKKGILTALLLNFALQIFALAGFTQYIPDNSGEYVYYRDYTFSNSESYIGILCYDQNTYQIKYYSPANKELKKPEKNLAIAVTINAKADHWDMTGERILTAITQDSDDLDILNYLHDLLYDFSSIRKKAGDVSPNNVNFKSSNVFAERGLNYSYDYQQFGGKVNILFDPLIPIFNLKSITSEEGITLFECATTGWLVNSEDKSFDNFRGIYNAYIPGAAKTVAKAKAKKYTTENKIQSFTLDENWAQPMENVWTNGDESVLATATIPALYTDLVKNETFVLRKLLESVGGAYTVLPQLELLYNAKTNQYKLTYISDRTDAKQVVMNTKIFNYSGTDLLMFSLAVYYNDYSANLNYYNKIIKSYSVKK